jgi:autotransporter translocation and assembly factor TamB
MKRLWRIILWIAAGTFALLLTIVVGALIFTRTARFNDLLRVQIISYLAQTYRGSITIRSIEGSVWGSLTLRDIEMHHGGTTIASIPQLRVGYQILPALQGQIVVSYVDLLNPELALAHDPDGQWNLLAAIAQRQPSPSSSSPSALTIALRRLSIEQARVTVTTAPQVTYRLTDANIKGTGHIGLSGQTFNADTIAFALSGPQMPPVRAQGAGEYTETAQVATIKVPGFSIWTDHSRLDFSATLRDLSEKNLNATINLRRLAAADVNSIAPQLGLARDVAGTISVSGKASDMRTAIDLTAANARLKANLQANVARPEPIWKLDSQLAAVDLRKLLKRRNSQELPAGEINATVRANGSGFSPVAARGGVDARVTGLGARGLRLGDLTFTAAVDHQIANLKALLAGPGGRAQLAGRVDIAKVPAYNLILTLDHLRPTNVIKVAGIPPVNLNLSAAIDGSGYQPDTMRARAQVRLLPSTVRAIRIDSGHLDAQLSAGIVRIATASLKAGDTSVDLNGQLALDPRRSGSLNYKVAVGQVSQWLALVGRRGSGRIDLAGSAQGSLKALSTTGSAQLSTLHVDSYSVAHARLTYNVSGLGTPLKPAGQAMLMASGLHAGIELKSLQTTVHLIPGATLGAAVNVSAEDRLSHPATIRANIAYKPGLTVANLTELAVATEHGSWQLGAPAQITQRSGTIEIRRFAAGNQDQSVNLDGTLSLSGPQNMTLRVQRVRLADFAGFVPGQVKILGLASTELTVRGTAAAPLIAMSGSITQLNLAGIPQAGMSVRLSYGNGRAQAQATLAQDAAHSLTANAALPFALSWAQGFQSRPTGDVDLRAMSSGLDLAVLNAVRNPQISGVGGFLSLDIAARGQLAHPVPHGFIRLSGVHASAPKLKVDVTGGSADIQLDAGAVRLVSLSAKAGDGTLTGAGALTLKPNGAPDQVDVRVALDQWPAIATHEYKATIAARLNAVGPMTAMRAGGKIEVLYGIFRPDLSVTGSAPRPDQTLTVVHRWSENPQNPRPPPPSVAATGPTFRNLTIDMDIVIDRNTWIKTADFAVELEGRLNIHKKRGREQPSISGTINTVRGTLVVASSQFDLTHGEITFTGGHDINPELLIVAQRQVQTYTVSATVGGTADKPTLTLGSIPDLPQADILSVMMFGKTTSQLSGGQQKDLQSQALSMAGGYAASQIGQAVAQSLGLGELGVTTNSAGVGLGRYLTKNIYVSATQSSSNMSDRRAEIQYYITPNVNVGTSASTNYGNEIKLQWHKDY